MTVVLHTQRFTLRPYSLEDADFVLDMYSRWDVQRYLGTAPRLMADRTEAIERIEHWAALDHPIHGIWLALDTETGRRLGTLLLKDLPASGDPLAPSGETEIGWHLHPDVWGHGVATETAHAVLDHAFAGGLDHVLAATYPENIPSQRVAERIGMQSLGLTTAYYNVECALFRAERPI
ncbi:MAG: GNAT family N-acetyltransferase [Marmoricola sp.]